MGGRFVGRCCPAGLQRGGDGGDWPNYRGPDYNGISGETAWRSDWGDKGPQILWRANVGKGSSALSIASGRAFTMGNDGGEEGEEMDSIYCLDAETGRTIWKHNYPCPLLPKYYEGGALSTPTVEGGFVFALSKMGDLLCLEAANGKVVWERQLNRKLGFELPTWHFSSSPLIVGEKLILNLGMAGAAFDKRNGEMLWNNGREVCGYSTPVPARIGGTESVVICGADSLLGVRISDGKLLWRHPFFNKHKANCGDAIVAGDEVFASSAYGRGCVKIRVVEERAIQVFDNTAMRNLQSSCVLWKGRLYGLDERALKCIDFKDGRACWSEGGMGKGSLSMSADGRLLVMGEKGELVIAKASPDAFHALARARVFLTRATCRTAPVLANGRIYLRNGRGEVVCLDVRR